MFYGVQCGEIAPNRAYMTIQRIYCTQTRKYRGVQHNIKRLKVHYDNFVLFGERCTYFTRRISLSDNADKGNPDKRLEELATAASEDVFGFGITAYDGRHHSILHDFAVHIASCSSSVPSVSSL